MVQDWSLRLPLAYATIAARMPGASLVYRHVRVPTAVVA
jgi:DHA2 family methylenomycin A resistance protein-like MFS transporter